MSSTVDTGTSMTVWDFVHPHYLAPKDSSIPEWGLWTLSAMHSAISYDMVSN